MVTAAAAPAPPPPSTASARALMPSPMAGMKPSRLEAPSRIQRERRQAEKGAPLVTDHHAAAQRKTEISCRTQTWKRPVQPTASMAWAVG